MIEYIRFQLAKVLDQFSRREASAEEVLSAIEALIEAKLKEKNSAT